MSTVTLATLIDGFVNFQREKPLDHSSLGRLAYWRSALGDRRVIEISPDDVDAALMQLQERGRLKAGRNLETRRTGEPLKGSTVNRYLSTFGEVFKHARRLRLVPRAHVSPLTGLERAPEPVDPNRYLRPEQIEKLIKVARLVDRQWKKLPALIRLAFVTGLRVGALTEMRWQQLDLDARLIELGKQKNGDPITATLNDECVQELKKLPRPADDSERVFRGTRSSKPMQFRRLWNQVCAQAGLPGRNFHQVRHGTGSFLAMSNVNQAGIMAVMGHRTLAASRRYMHHNTADKRAITERVFGK